MRGHLPLLLALSANSPFWQGRDTGLASARTPLFQAFPRVGIPRAVQRATRDYVSAVDLLIRCGAFPEPTFLWWDVRPQPRFGTVEVRIMDAQTTVGETAALAALVQCIARLEVEQGYLPPAQLDAVEALDENRFLAARDGVAAELIDVDSERRIPVAELLDPLLASCVSHARALGCKRELEQVRALAAEPGAARQVEMARRSPERLPGLVGELAARFSSPAGVTGSDRAASSRRRTQLQPSTVVRRHLEPANSGKTASQCGKCVPTIGRNDRRKSPTYV